MPHARVPPSPTYLHDIPSVHQSNPAVPAILGAMDLNRGIQAGAPIDPQNLAHAKTVAKALQTIHELSMDERVTAGVAESAELRAAAVEAAHVSAIYTPVDIAQALQNINNQLTIGFVHVNQHLDGVDQCMEQILAISLNNRVLAYNRHINVPSAYRPLYKTIQGNGLNLATNIYGHIPQLQNILVAPDQEPLVGTVPPNFNHDYMAYGRPEIVRLIIFYNEDFGIVAGDTVAMCVDKFHLFLTAY